MNRSFVIFLVLLILASIKYFYKFEERAFFEFDQEYLAWQAKEILVDKKFSLIGAPTSVGGMFIGPLYNYFMAMAFYLGGMHPYTVSLVSNFWAALNLLLIFWISQKLAGWRTAFFSFLLALFSFSFLNQAGLPPLLFPLPLISLLIFYFLSQKPQKALLLGTLTGLALHLHFTALFFLPLVIFFLEPLNFKPLRSKVKNIFLFMLPVFVFSLPLLIFDLRHHFFISQNLFIFLKQKNNLSFNFLNQFLNSFKICLENLGNLFFNTTLALKLILALFFIISYLFLKQKKKLDLTLAWLFIPPFCFSFYGGHIINYYYVLQEPIFLILVGEVLASLSKKLLGRFFLISFLFLFIFFNFKNWYLWQAEPSLYAKLSVFNFIKKKVKDKPFYLSFTIESPWMGGYHYLSYFFKFKLQPQPNSSIYPTYTIIYPSFWQGIKPDYVFGSIGLGVPKNE